MVFLTICSMKYILPFNLTTFHIWVCKTPWLFEPLVFFAPAQRYSCGQPKPTCFAAMGIPILEMTRMLLKAGKLVFRIYWWDWHKPISLKLNIYHFEPQIFAATNNWLKIPKNAQSTHFSRLKMILQKLNIFYEPFSRYIASKVITLKHNYLSWYLCLRKFWQCKELYREFKLEYLHFQTFKFWRCRKQLGKNTEKCAIDSSWRWSHKIGPFLQAFWPQ